MLFSVKALHTSLKKFNEAPAGVAQGERCPANREGVGLGPAGVSVRGGWPISLSHGHFSPCSPPVPSPHSQIQ